MRNLAAILRRRTRSPLGAQSGTGLVRLVLAWDNDTADTTPDFTCSITNPLVGDTLTLQLYSDAGLTTLVDSAVNTLDAGEVSAKQADFALDALSDGTYYARVLFERTGWTSAYSNTVTVTISSGPTTGRLLEDGSSFRLLEDGTSFRLLEG